MAFDSTPGENPKGGAGREKPRWSPADVAGDGGHARTLAPDFSSRANVEMPEAVLGLPAVRDRRWPWRPTSVRLSPPLRGWCTVLSPKSP